MPTLNAVDNYGPSYMRIAKRLGGYDTTTEDAANTVEMIGLEPGSRVLDAGCGFGRFSAALMEHRCDTVGVDISPAAIAEAERRCPGPTYLVADLLEPLPYEAGFFDALVNVYSSFGYGATEAEDMEMLHAFRRALRPGGHLVMQLSDLERSRYRLKTDVGVVVRDTNGVTETLDVDFSTGMLHVRYELDDDVVDSCIRMYEADDLEQMVQEAGFRDIKRYGDFTKCQKKPGDRLVLVARAT